MPTNNEPFEEMLNQRSKHFISFLETTPDYVYSKDLDNRFLFCSQSLAKISGHSSWQDMIGKTDFDCFPNETALIDREEEATIFKKGKPLIDKVQLFYDEFGNEEWLSTNKWPLKNDQGKVIGLFGISRNITKQKHFLDELKKSENKFRKTFMTGLDAFYTSSLEDGLIIDTNPIFEEIFGFSHEEITGKTLIELGLFNNPDDHKRMLSKLKADGFVKDLVLQGRKKNGEPITVSISSTVFNLGNSKYISGTVKDITEQKKIEEQQKENQARIELVMKSASILFWEMDLATGYVKSDPRVLEKLGYKSENFTQKNDYIALLHPDDLECCTSAMDNHIKGLIDKFEIEFRIRTNKGDYKWFYNLGTINKRNETGAALSMAGIVIDTSETKRSEKSIDDTNRRFRTIFEDAPLGIALIELLTGAICDANPMFAKITGRSVLELVNTTWMNITHPDDIQFDFDKKELLVNGKIDKFQMEKRFIRPDDSIVWVNMTISRMIKEENIPLYHLCMIEDITSKKAIEEKLIILSKAFEQSPSSIIITNAKGNIEYANRKFTETSGYGLNEVIGTPPKQFQSSYTSKKEYKLLWETILAGNTWEGEFYNKKKNGDLFWEAAKISTVKNEKGVATHFMEIKEDITERKLMEKKMKNIAWHQSHQVRGPLTTIMGIIAAMNFKITIEEKLTLLGRLDEAANKLDTAVRTIVGETTPPKL